MKNYIEMSNEELVSSRPKDSVGYDDGSKAHEDYCNADCDWQDAMEARGLYFEHDTWDLGVAANANGVLRNDNPYVGKCRFMAESWGYGWSFAESHPTE